jgi:2-oxoglutarate dehydrogenase E1 component
MADDAGRLNQVFAETSFLYGANAAFIEDLHEKWANDPASVSGEWRSFFDQLKDSAAVVKASGAAGGWGRGAITEPTEETGVFDGQWPAPKIDPKKAGAAPAKPRPPRRPQPPASPPTRSAPPLTTRSAP